MTRRGTANKNDEKENKPVTPRVLRARKKDEKEVLTSSVRSKNANEISGGSKRSSPVKATKANISTKASKVKTSQPKAITVKTNTISKANTAKATAKPTTSTLKNVIITPAEIKPIEISSDVSDYYSEDDSDDDCDHSDWCSNDDCPHCYDPDYSEFFSDYYDDEDDMFFGGRCAYDSDNDYDRGYGHFSMFDSDDNDSDSELDSIFRAFTLINGSSSVGLYASQTINYLQNFQINASPVVRARIQDFIRSSSSLPFDCLVDDINCFRDELIGLTGGPLPDFPVFNQPPSRSSLSNSDISRLPRHKYRGQTQREKRLKEQPHKCCICMAELEVGEELILLEKCSHRFHATCLESWLRRSNNCPICRNPVKPPPIIIN